MRPRVRATQLIVEELPTETIVYDLKRHRVHCLNQTAALIWKGCDGSNTLAEIADRLGRETGMPANEDIVRLGIREFDELGLMAGKAVAAKQNSRRELLARLGMVAGLLPAITSIVAPSPAMATSRDEHGNGSRGRKPMTPPRGGRSMNDR